MRDATAAEDVAQETWRVTLAQPPGRVEGGARLRAWLGGVARRLAVDRVRADRSRAIREAASAPHDAQSQPHEPHEIVLRSARQQRVVAAVMSLAEPYRSTVLYRYFDELPTREVAARMAVSEEVVRKRLERGLAQLRQQLDAEFGAPTRQWASVLLAGPGVIAMAAKAKTAGIAAGLVLALGATATWQWLQRDAERVLEPANATAELATAPVIASPTEAEENRPPAADRIAVETAVPVAGDFAGTVIPVAVVNAAGEPCLEGRLSGFWNELPRVVPNDDDFMAPREEYLRAFAVEIAGPLTELRLPARTGSIRIDASVPGLPASASFGVRDDASRGDAIAGRPHRWRTVKLVVGEPVPTPSLRGFVLVDGQRRTPSGLLIDPTDFEVIPEDFTEEYPDGSYLRQNAADSSYVYAQRPDGAFKLWVTSDETVPLLVEVDDDATTLDLELESGRTLELTVLDRATGRIVQGVELHAAVNVITERGFFR